MKRIPIALILLRLLLGIAVLLLAIFPVDHYRGIIICFFTTGLLSDIFDGIIARRLGVSTTLLRRLDSTIDQIFWLLVVAAAVIISPNFFRQNIVELSILIGLEALAYAISFARFKKEVATHAIASKVWTLLLFATLIDVIAYGNSGWLFTLCLYVGIITRLEIIAILFLLRKWENDVPSVYHAVQLRRGKNIRRSKLFNG